MNAVNLHFAEKINKKYELNYLEFNYQKTAVNISFPEEYFYIVQIKKGEGYFICDFKEHKFSGPAILAVSKGETSFIKFSSTNRISFDIIVFSEHILVCPEAHIRMKDLPVLQRNKEVSVFQPNSDKYIGLNKCFEKIKTEIGSSFRWKWNLIRIYLAEILIGLSRILTENNYTLNESFDDAINLLYQLIEEHFKEHLTIDYYSTKLGLSSTVLAKKIKVATGTTFQTILNDRIITEAMRKLFTTGISIKEIAYELGYDDPAYFYRIFKKVSGYTPQEFRTYALKKYT